MTAHAFDLEPTNGEPIAKVLPYGGGFAVLWKTNARFSEAGVMTIGIDGGSPLYGFPDDGEIYDTRDDAEAALKEALR